MGPGGGTNRFTTIIDVPIFSKLRVESQPARTYLNQLSVSLGEEINTVLSTPS